MRTILSIYENQFYLFFVFTMKNIHFSNTYKIYELHNLHCLIYYYLYLLDYYFNTPKLSNFYECTLYSFHVNNGINQVILAVL